MAVDRFHDLFVASAGVAGALIGLLFVAISVARERLETEDGSQIHRVGAAAALTSFTNALTVSLFGLVPGNALGDTAFVVGILGLVFVAAALLSLWRVRAQESSASSIRDLTFLVSLAVVFVIQIIAGLATAAHPELIGHTRTLAILVIVCFLIGITRSWVLIGGPSIGLRGEIAHLVRDAGSDRDSESD